MESNIDGLFIQFLCLKLSPHAEVSLARISTLRIWRQILVHQTGNVSKPQNCRKWVWRSTLAAQVGCTLELTSVWPKRSI